MPISPKTLHVAQGEQAISSCADTMITAVLGSCVATCLWDPKMGIGGMNHILLPDDDTTDLRMAYHGTNAMELLINGLLQQGVCRRRLQGKLFGGARMIEGLSDIGARNSAFARGFFEREEIPCVGISLGGSNGRRVQFWPASGRARQQFLINSPIMENPVQRTRPATSDVELF